jgi:hypothetical protein
MVLEPCCAAGWVILPAATDAEEEEEGRTDAVSQSFGLLLQGLHIIPLLPPAGLTLCSLQ